MKRSFINMIVIAAITLFAVTASAQFRGSVAQVYVEEVGRGTGFFVTRSLIMTNKHVVATAYDMVTKEYTEFADSVIISHGGISIRGLVVAVSPKYDLAIIMVRGKGPRPFKFCKKVDPEKEVEIWTYDFGKFREKTGNIRDSWGSFFVTSVSVIHGNSGSPLIQNRGLRKCVAGVTFAAYVRSGEGLHLTAVVAREFLNGYLNSLQEED
jgi:S1-C subfamily serine protease